jgi:hypothetical protein
MTPIFHTNLLHYADISGLYLVQSLNCGVHHHYDTTTAVPATHTAADRCAQQQTVTATHTCILQVKKNRQ